ncbi:hypothetical protein [Endozoicomonas sp.]|uniref:hypothetical protein n=1 Tax=Endozoicomonas sp. TaxID=1892382 RepID=UPI0028865FA4|nr:hypothetical protein [Endozoicomonas sp.]
METSQKRAVIHDEIKKLQRNVEGEFGSDLSFSEDYSLNIEGLFEWMAVECEEMVDEYKKHEGVIDELRRIMEKLSKTKLEMPKLFVEKLNVLKKESVGRYADSSSLPVGNEKLFNSLVLEKDPEKGKRYLMELVRFSNFLEGCPRMVKEITAVNNYFEKNKLAQLERIDDSSAGARAFDNKIAELLNKRSWLSNLCFLTQTLSAIKKWVGRVDLFVNDKEKMKEAFRWVDGKSDDEIIVLIFGFVQRE